MIQTIPLAVLLLPFAPAHGDEIAPRPLAEDEELAPLAALWADRMDTFDVPGAAVAVVRDGEVFVHAMGVRDADGRLAVDAHTMFYIASITKTFTAMAACALVEDGLVELDDPVAELLPRFDLPDGHEEIEESATLRDLLSHRWGINSGPVVLLDAYTGEITDERYWHWLARGSVAGRPVYTNVNFTLAGQIVEEAAGKDWRDWLQTRVLEPAGMTRTTGYASRLYGDPNSAVPMERGADGFVPTAQRKTDRTMHAAG
ncbi:MAG: serine hydrolase domain-containing protein, partial [Planctomycetota bacterium]